jgi:hypothetical protein
LNTAHWRDILGEDLAVTLNLPVTTSRCEAMQIESAVRLLEIIAVIEDGSHNRNTDEQPSPDLERIEMKLDLLIYLFSASLNTQIPEPVTILVSADGFVLPEPYLPDETKRIAIYVCTWLKQPLVLDIDSIHKRNGESGARWQHNDLTLRNALSRWIFRVHRREVARKRAEENASLKRVN